MDGTPIPGPTTPFDGRARYAAAANGTARPGAAPQAPPVRATDADRLAMVHRLQDGVARGALTPDEGGDRMAAAWAAVHLRDLAPLTADLPPVAAPPRVTAPGWRPLGLMAWEQVRTTVAGARAGRPAAVRIALVGLVTLLVLVALGSLVLHGLAEGLGGGPDGFGGGPGGFDGFGDAPGGFDGFGDEPGRD
ncbi:DUF1707 domain-containing protein [Geodermatophilus sp. SYSU D01180]